MLIQKKYFPIILLILINIIIGFLIIQDFGESWDEITVYSYAEMSTDAYKNFFHVHEMNNYYGDDILRYYGPAFPIFKKLVISPFKSLNYNEITSVWHLLNFLCFQLGLFFLYDICLRYFSKLVAFISTTLFCTQPLLWGHAFINPRDIPFMVFFLGAISFGLSFSDFFNAPTTDQLKVNNTREEGSSFWKDFLLKDLNIGLQKKQTFFKVLLGCIVFLIVMLFSHLSNRLVEIVIYKLYYSNDENIFSQLFFHFAQNVQSIPIESYIKKAITIINSLGTFLLLSLLFLLLIVCFNFFQISIKHINDIYLKRNILILHSSIISWWQKIRIFGKKINPNLHIEFQNHFLTVKSSLSFLKSWRFWFASFLLGLCISTRIAGPFAGLLISLALFKKAKGKSIFIIPGYFIISFLVVYITWPFLWGDPINRFLESFSVMSNFLWDERILFNGEYLKGYALPRSYFPSLLCIQLTESTVILFLIGLVIASYRFIKNKISRVELFIHLGWFFIPFIGILLFRAPMYDNTRHFLFIFPPLFIFAGFSIQKIYERTNRPLFALSAFLILLPGIFNIISLHPYSYVYYNSFVGGLNGAYNRYEMDYYGTSYKETTEYLNKIAKKNAKVLVTGPIHLVMSYARKDLILTTAPAHDSIANYDYLIYLNRFKYAGYLADQPEIFRVERGGATFSGIRKLDY